MTVPSTDNRIVYTGSGITGPFTVPFYFLEDDDLLVIKVLIADGSETELALTTDYTLTGAGVAAGGALTLVVAISSSYNLVIVRNPDLLQEADYTPNDDFPAETHERGLDKLTMIAQRLQDLMDRSVRQPDGDAVSIAALPPKVERAGTYFGWDVDGDPVASAVLLDTPVSAYAATLLDDTTAEEAQATLDLANFPVAGRLCMLTGQPTTSSPNNNTIFFTPYLGNRAPVYDGTRFVWREFAEMSQTLADATKSPAAAGNSTMYDMFLWRDGTTMRCTRGPAWTNSAAGTSARGAGVGTTELEWLLGRLVNKVAITNGPAAQRGLYVGSIRTDAGGAVSDYEDERHLWNMYNRVQRNMRSDETANSWAYSNATVRQANANTNNRLRFIIGWEGDCVEATVHASALNDSTGLVKVGVGINSTTAFYVDSMGSQAGGVINNVVQLQAHLHTELGAGYHEANWLEASSATGTTTFYGDNGTTNFQNGITGALMM